jgi:hypothetical protein
MQTTTIRATPTSNDAPNIMCGLEDKVSIECSPSELRKSLAKDFEGMPVAEVSPEHNFEINQFMIPTAT